MVLTSEHLDVARRILHSPVKEFSYLISVAGLNPRSDFRYANLQRVDFGQADLMGFDFTGANLRGANFSRASMTGAVLNDADTTGAVWPSGWRVRLTDTASPDTRGLEATAFVPDRLFGRDAEISELVAAVAGPSRGLVAVLGGAGIGKTTLVRGAATSAGVLARFGDRRWFVPLDTASDGSAVRSAVALALGANPADPDAFRHALAELAAAPSLLVLDGLETSSEGDPSGVAETLRCLVQIPTLSVLTSVRGGAGPSAIPYTHHLILSPIAPEAARRLFGELAPSIELDDPHLEPFLRELGGVPLAIELVALRAAPLASLAELWSQWQRLGTTLATDPDLPAGRLTSLTRSIDLSWRSRRLLDEGRRLFRLLGALPSGMAREDRAALLGDDATEAARQLMAIGLVVNRDGRLDLLPPVRDWGRRLAPATEVETDRWCRHYLELLADLEPRFGTAGGAEVVARLAREATNVDAAFAASHKDRLPQAVAAADGFGDLLRFTGLGSSATLHNLATACHAAGDPNGEARCQLAAGAVAFHRSDHGAARVAYEQALPLFRQVGDVLGEADCIRSLGDIALRRSEHDAARAAYEQALPLYRQVGDVLGEANCIKSLGDIALARSQHDAARGAYEQALPLYRQVGAVLGEANCIKSLGDIALARSQHDAARAAYERALPLYRQVGDVLGEANCIKSLGDIALARSQHDAARGAYEQALPLFRQVGDVLGEANCILHLGDIALARSQHDAARGAYEQALPLYRQVGDVLGEANCIRSLGDIAREQGGTAAARGRYKMALALYALIPEPYSIGATHFRLAELADGGERAAHVAAAREAWTSIDRPDLVALLDRFG